MKQIGWYSPKQRQASINLQQSYIYAWYVAPANWWRHEDGHPVLVTEVKDEGKPHDIDDAVSVGPVINYIRPATVYEYPDGLVEKE